jgi:hypothetical protein
MTSTSEVELLRARWRRYREPLHLLDPHQEDFAQGGLAARVQHLSVRLLVLPADPEAVVVEFDATFWAWWATYAGVSLGDVTVEWGKSQNSQPSVSAALHLTSIRPSDDPFVASRYLAVHRSGAIEMALGDYGAYEQKGGRQFLLISIVARTWAALVAAQAVADRWSISGPWELTLALCGTRDAVLTNVGEGWAEPWEFEPRRCLEPSLLFRLEPEGLPEAEAIQALAERLGGWIEDGFGYRERRFRARRGPFDGRLDIRGVR